MTAAANKSTDDEKSNNKKQTLLKFMVQRFITSMKVKANLFFFFMEIQLLILVEQHNPTSNRYS
jgi:hypothetical protein